jgi:hypothetical protein
MLYSGVDLHRRLIVICTVDANGSVLARKSMKTQPEFTTEPFWWLATSAVSMKV